jgi:hypothetical protein
MSRSRAAALFLALFCTAAACRDIRKPHEGPHPVPAGEAPNPSQPTKVTSGGQTAAEGVEESLRIREVRLQEGSTGFFLEVTCVDPASSDGRRCQLLEQEVSEGVHLEPKLPFSISPTRGGFRLFADFKRGAYQVAFDAGLRSVDGSALPSRYEQRFEVGARRSALALPSAGRYLPRSAWRSLPITHRNLSQVELTVRNVPPENLVFWMSDPDREAADARSANVLLRKTLNVRGAPDTTATTWLDVGGLLPATTQGIIELELKAGELQARARVLLTNLSLIAKRFRWRCCLLIRARRFCASSC